MDPRIRRRRIEVKRGEGRRRLRILVGSVAVAALIVGVVGATRSPLMDVDHVVVTGGAHVTAEQIVAVAGLRDQPQLIDVGTKRVARKAESLPWVATATVIRQWPSTVKVHVTERMPAASLPAEGGRWAVADAGGRVLEVLDARPSTMPSVAGAPPAGGAGTRLSPAGREAMAVAAALTPDLRGITAELAVTADGEIELHVVPAGVIRLGDASQLPDKLTAAATVLAGLAPKSWRVLDVRVPRAPVLARR
jgi:cell division protein FtsQ